MRHSMRSIVHVYHLSYRKREYSMFTLKSLRSSKYVRDYRNSSECTTVYLSKDEENKRKALISKEIQVLRKKLNDIKSVKNNR